MEKIEKILQNVEKFGVTAQGKKEFISHIQGKKITRKQSMIAKCYDCMDYYADGKIDCKVNHCPMYLYMLYRN